MELPDQAVGQLAAGLQALRYGQAKLPAANGRPQRIISMGTSAPVPTKEARHRRGCEEPAMDAGEAGTRRRRMGARGRGQGRSHASGDPGHPGSGMGKHLSLPRDLADHRRRRGMCARRRGVEPRYPLGGLGRGMVTAPDSLRRAVPADACRTTIREWMRHKTLDMTLRYAYLAPEHTQAAPCGAPSVVWLPTFRGGSRSPGRRSLRAPPRRMRTWPVHVTDDRPRLREPGRSSAQRRRANYTLAGTQISVPARGGKPECGSGITSDDLATV